LLLGHSFLCNSELKIFSVTLFRDPSAYGSDFDPKIAYRKPPVILKIVPKAGYECTVYTRK
jgi:hypothetical protein